jgi:hypothetical protein
VRFEIAHSLFRKNGLFTVFIHNVQDPQRGACVAGRNPLDFMALAPRADGRGDVWENFGGSWRPFTLAKRPVPWPAWLPRCAAGYVMPLSEGARSYDYSLEDGHRDLPSWAHDAAKAAGR